MDNEQLIPLQQIEKYTKSRFYDLYGDLSFYVKLDDWFLVSDHTSESSYSDRVYLQGYFPVTRYWKASSMEESIAHQAYIVFNFDIKPSELNYYKLPEKLKAELDLIYDGDIPTLASQYREDHKPNSLYNLWVKRPDLIKFLENHGLEKERQRVIDDFMDTLIERKFIPIAEYMELQSKIDEQAEEIEQLKRKALEQNSADPTTLTHIPEQQDRSPNIEEGKDQLSCVNNNPIGKTISLDSTLVLIGLLINTTVKEQSRSRDIFIDSNADDLKNICSISASTAKSILSTASAAFKRAKKSTW